MLDSDESRKEVIRPDFNRAIMIDFQGATITSDVGFLLLREIDDRFQNHRPYGRLLGGPKVTYAYETFISPDDSSKGLPDRRPNKHSRTEGVVCSKSAEKIHFDGN